MTRFMIRMMPKAKAIRLVVYFVVSVVLSVTAFRSILLTPGVVGHTWDWGLPHFIEQYKTHLFSQFFLWDAQVYGGKIDLFKTEIPFWILLYPSSFIGWELTSKLVPVMLGTIGFLTMAYLCRRLLRFPDFWSYAAGLLYAFSPYVYSRIIAGHLTMVLGYILLPLFMYFLFSLRESASKGASVKKLLFLCLLTPFIALQPYMFIILLLMLLGLYVMNIVIRHARVNIVVALIFAALGLLLNSYWTVPLAYSYLSGGGITLRPNELVELEAAKRVNYFQSISQPISNLISFNIPYGLHTEFVYPVEGWWHVFILSSVIIFTAAFLCFFVVQRNEKHWQLKLLYGVFLIGIGITAGSKTIIGQLLFAFLLKFVPSVFAGFSNPLRLLPLISLPLTILAVATFAKIDIHVQRRLRVRFPVIRILFIIILVVESYPWFIRPLTKPVFPGDSQPLSLKVTSINPEDDKIIDLFASDTTDSRTAILPPSFVSWPGETTYSFSWTSSFQPKPVFLESNEQPLATIILNELYSQDSTKTLTKLLGLGAMASIIYPHYYQYESYVTYIEGTRNYKPYVDRNLMRQEGLQKDNSTLKSIDTYVNENFVSHIYIPTQVTYADSQDRQGLVGISEQSAYELRNAVFFSPDNMEPKIKRLGTLDKTNVIYAQALCAGCEMPKILDYELNPAPRFLPTSIFYAYTKLKEQRLINAVKVDDKLRAYTDLVLATKKLAEMRTMIKDKSEKYLSATYSLVRFNQLLEDFRKSFEIIQTQGLGVNEEMLKYLVFLNKHIDELDKIILASQNGDIVNLAEKSRNNLSSIYEEVREKVWRTDSTNDYKYTFSVPTAGEYQILQKISQGGLKPYKIEIDGKDVTQKSTTTSGEWAKIDSVELTPASHTLRALLPTRENKFTGFQTSPAISYLQDATTMLSSQRDVVQVSAPLQALDDRFLYRVSFDYRIIGSPVRFTVEQLNDGAYKGKLLHKIDIMLSDRGGWARVDLPFAPNFGSTEAVLKFYLQSTKQPENPSNVVNTYLLKNIRLEQVDRPEYLLQKIQLETPANTPKIIFTKINPTKYVIDVKGAEKPYFLVFSESFHEGWKAFVSESRIKNNESGNISASYFGGEIQEGEHQNIFWDKNLFENVFKKPIPEENHLLVNAYANSWYIDKQGDYEITLEFVPQRTYFVALIISGVTFVVVVIGLGVLLIKKKRYGAN